MIQFSRYVCILFLMTAAVMPSGCLKNGEGSLDTTNESLPSVELTVQAAPVGRRDWIDTVLISGSLRSSSTVDIKPEIGGRLITTHVQDGDSVRTNQLLAEIDDVNYRLVYDQSAASMKVAQAGLERAMVSVEHAETEKERADNLLSSGGITQKDHQAAATGLKEAGTQVSLAEAQLLQAKAALAIAEKSLKDCKIFSPAGGHIQKRWLDKGSLLSPGVTLYTLVDNELLELECVVPSYQLASIRMGQKAEFTTPTWGEGRRFSGIVSSISPTVESDNRSIKIKLRIDNREGVLRNGMYARGEIITGHIKDALVIPGSSLISAREESETVSVYVVRNGTVELRRVRTGGSQNDSVRVTEGLDEGEMVIVERGPSLKEGIHVRIASNPVDSGVKP